MKGENLISAAVGLALGYYVVAHLIRTGKPA